MTLKKTMLAAVVAGMLTSTAQASLVISEYVEGSSSNKALELHNPGATDIDLAGWTVELYFNGATTASTPINLSGSVGAGGYFVIANSSADPVIIGVANQTSGALNFNGDDAIVIRDNSGSITDSLGQVGFDPGSEWGSGDTSTQDNTLRRLDGSAPDLNPDDAFEPSLSYAGFPQNTFDGLASSTTGDTGSVTSPDMTCGAEATLISAIQGNSAASPLNGSDVVVEAVVTGVFNGSGGLGGFFVEEESNDRDANPASSEGLFIYGSQSVTVGDTVRIAGTVTEYFDLTELTAVTDLVPCGNGALPAAAVVGLPWNSDDAAEAFESMRVTFASPLTVNDTYDLTRYGSLTLGSGRHFIPTNVATPGAEAALVAEVQALDRILLDDGFNSQNPAMVPYPAPQLSAGNTVRAGDQVHNLSGILHYSYSEWRLQPIATPDFTKANARTTGPALNDRGNLVVASFNVLNYFNGDGLGGGFPTSRGADTAEELARQTAKLVSAINGLNADVVGLMEIENDGYDASSAIAELASALGASWSWVDPGLEGLGTDEIAVGFIYRNDRVETVGAAATLASGAFSDLNRQPLAQTFRLTGSDDGLTVVVNHFKSKGCGSAEGIEADQGDGQGCWNPTRTQAAQELATWLAADATATGEPDVLIIGDLNAYAKEDPIQALAAAGYTDLLATFAGEQAYTYVFYGQAGYLDHGHANASLLKKVADAGVWKINADEPRGLDYNTEFKSTEQVTGFYAADPYRASDHDPVIVALTMATANEPPSTSDPVIIDEDTSSDESTTAAPGSSSGCAYNPGAPFDPTLLLMAALAMAGLSLRKRKAAR